MQTSIGCQLCYDQLASVEKLGIGIINAKYFYRIFYGGKDGRERDLMAANLAKAANLQTGDASSGTRLPSSSASLTPRPPGAGQEI